MAEYNSVVPTNMCLANQSIYFYELDFIFENDFYLRVFEISAIVHIFFPFVFLFLFINITSKRTDRISKRHKVSQEETNADTVEAPKLPRFYGRSKSVYNMKL